MPDSENGYHKKNHLILAATGVSSVGKTVRGTCKAAKQKCGPKLVRLVSGSKSRRFGRNSVRDRYKTILTLPYTSTSVLFNHLGILTLLGCNKDILTKRVIWYTNHENLRKAHWDVNMPSRAKQPVGYEQIRAPTAPPDRRHVTKKIKARSKLRSYFQNMPLLMTKVERIASAENRRRQTM